jgi:antitoxin (DNA-binding transcriptional repressor) of toxin-antitoxin stability system
MPLLAIVLAAALAPLGPTLAVEDTMHTAVGEVLVRAPRVTLGEILDRVARGEARRESLLTDQSFLATARVVAHADERNKPPELMSETVFRVYRKRPDKSRAVVLRRYQAHPPKDKGPRAKVEVRFGPDMGEEIVNFAFRPKARRDYRYHIVGRDIVGGHVVYRIAFEPRSLLTPGNPSGLVWVDTNDFVIVRQEVSFGRSPVPMFLERIDRLVIERTQVGGHWLLKRVLVRATATLPLPRLGRSFDLGLQMDDWAVNTGLGDSLFAGHGAGDEAGEAAPGR